MAELTGIDRYFHPASDQSRIISNTDELSRAFSELISARESMDFGTFDADVELDKSSICAKRIFDSYRKFKNLDVELEGDIRRIDDATKKMVESEKAIQTAFREFRENAEVVVEGHQDVQVLDEQIKACRETMAMILCRARNDSIVTKKETTEKRRILRRNLDLFRDLMCEGISLTIPENQRTPHICPICFERTVKIVAVPCGHTFCAECQTSWSENTCACCRSAVNSYNPLYFST